METTRQPNVFWNPPSWVFMGLLLVGVLTFKLVLPLISGLVLFVLITSIYRFFEQYIHKNETQVALFLKSHPIFMLSCSVFIAVGVFLGTLAIGVLGVSAMVDTQRGIAPLMVQITSALSMIKENLPVMFSNYVPTNAYALLHQAQTWLTENASIVADAGKKIISIVFRVVVGAFVGLLVGVRVVLSQKETSSFPHPYLEQIAAHLQRFASSFQRVFFAQFYIALTNTFFTGLFLGLIMPLLGFSVPFLGMLLVITFIMGFIPIVGNIVSNTAITLTALSLSPFAAFLALSFLVIIHKLEYFLNAWIVGNRIKVRSYELLIAMLCMEAVFGIWGLVLAPVIYSYIKDEFIAQNLSSQKNTPQPH